MGSPQSLLFSVLQLYPSSYILQTAIHSVAVIQGMDQCCGIAAGRDMTRDPVYLSTNPCSTVAVPGCFCLAPGAGIFFIHVVTLGEQLCRA